MLQKIRPNLGLRSWHSLSWNVLGWKAADFIRQLTTKQSPTITGRNQSLILFRWQNKEIKKQPES